MTKPVLTISSKNYGAWSLRGWLMARLAGLDFVEKIIPPDDPSMKAEILLLSSSMLVPSLAHCGITVWDTLAIGEYLNEVLPKAGLLPSDTKARAHCRAVCGEMHSGFSSLRGALPMNIKAQFKGFKVWSRAQSDIDRIVAIWKECLATYKGLYLFGAQPCMAAAVRLAVVWSCTDSAGFMISMRLVKVPLKNGTGRGAPASEKKAVVHVTSCGA